MNCEETRAALSDVLARAAEPDQVAAADAHLKSCGDCRDFGRELAAQDLGLREVVARSCQETSAGLRRKLATPARKTWILAAAAALLVAVAIYFIARPGEPATPVEVAMPPVLEKKQPPKPPPPPAPTPVVEEKPAPAVPVPVPVPEPTPTPLPSVANPPPAKEGKPEEPRPEPVVPKPAPSPSEAKPPPAKEGKKTATTVAVLEQVLGDVKVEGGAAAQGASLLADQSVQTGPLGWAIFRYPDSTRIELWGSTAARLSEEGKRIVLAQGTLFADVARQPADRPFVVDSAQGEIRVLGTGFRVSASEKETVLEVREGKVRLKRAADGRTVDVTAGYIAVAAPGTEFMPRLMQQQKGKKEPVGYPGVDQKKVDEAIQKGIDWLSRQDCIEEKKSDYHELVLYTLLHAGVSPSHPVFKTLLEKTVEQDLNKLGHHTTYRISLHAMFLSEFDAVKYQQRIAQCCQLLVDNQCENGQWSYGKPTTFPDAYPAVATGGKKVATPSKRPGVKPEPVKPGTLIRIKAQPQGPAVGDNSNSQYAALGLRACLEANVVPPKECLERGKKYWEETQNTSAAMAGGWSYGPGAGNSVGSMTAGGLGALIIFNHALYGKWSGDPHVEKAIACLGDMFTADANPRMKGKWHLYYLYAVERAGVFTARSSFGDHDWYREGANKILGLQKGDGSWDDSSDAKSGPVGSTCFAILFLKRGTPPLMDVASVDRGMPPRK